jgi:hypothetical protein
MQNIGAHVARLLDSALYSFAVLEYALWWKDLTRAIERN